MANIVAFVGYEDSPDREWLRKLLNQRGFSCIDFKTFREFRDKHPESELDFMICITRSGHKARSADGKSNHCPLQICQSVDCHAGESLKDRSSSGAPSTRTATADCFSRLTPREFQTLKLIALGWSSKQIAQELGIALRTVANHRASIRIKTGFTSIAQMVSAYLKTNSRDGHADV